MRVFLTKIAGITLILLGIAGLVLPVLQGWLFIFLGVSLLSPALGALLRRAVLFRIPGAEKRMKVVRLDEWRPHRVDAGMTTKCFPCHLSSTDDLDREDARAAVRCLWLTGKQPFTPERYIYLKQVHGSRVWTARRAESPASDFWRIGEGDALVTVEPRTALLVLSADCLPIFLIAMRGRKTLGVALAHAGWKGTHQKVAAESFRALKHETGAPDAEIWAAFGQSMDARHYEVGAEFQNYFPDPSGEYRRTSLQRRAGRWFFDLRSENRRQLIESGLPKSHLSDTGFSTVGHSRFFHSFRLEKEKAGRTVSFIAFE